MSIEECVASEMRNLDYYLVNSHETLLNFVAKEKGLVKERIEGKEEYKRRVEKEKKDSFIAMKMHGQFERDTKEIKTDESWNWLRRGELKRETESLILAAQEQGLNTNYVKKNVYGMDVSEKCRLCGKEIETAMHIASACSMLAQKEYKRRHDKVCSNLHWNLCKKYGIDVSEKWYQHKAETVVENERVKILWDFNVQCDRYIEPRRPDIIVIDKDTNECILIDVACPVDYNLVNKKTTKLRNYS